MAEYICREAIIDDLEKEIEAGNVALDEDVWINKGLRIAIRDIKDSKSIDVQPVDRWISVDKKLPEDNSMVLCYCRTTTGEGDLYMLGSYQKDSWFLKTSRIHSTFPNPQMQVLYWQPLPELPKEADNG